MSDSNETTTAAPEGVLFTSTADNYRVVKSPARRKPLGESGEYEVVKGKSFQFFDGELRVTDPDDIAWLREYPSYGMYYFEPEIAPVPESSAGIQRVIMEKALAGDFDSIADILVAERTALSRPDVLASCEAAINAGGKELPAKPDVPLHEQQRVRMGPAAGITPGVSPDPVPGTPMVDPSTLQPADSVAAPEPITPARETVPVSETPREEAPQLPPVPPADETEGQTPEDQTPPPAPTGSGDPLEPPAPPQGGAPGTPAS